MKTSTKQFIVAGVCLAPLASGLAWTIIENFQVMVVILIVFGFVALTGFGIGALVSALENKYLDN